MDDLKKRGIFEEIENMNEDFSSLKALIIERFRVGYFANFIFKNLFNSEEYTLDEWEKRARTLISGWIRRQSEWIGDPLRPGWRW